MSVILFLSVLLVFCAGYRIYGKRIADIVGIEPFRRTPAFTRSDRVDFVPAKNWSILFGHHFASIAGAGPIVGPVIAYMWWGWFGVLLWIVFGCIFFGAVHDFLALIISVREGGLSIGSVAEKYISRRAGKILLIFLWCSLIIVIAVFATLCSRSFVSQPQVVLPSLGLVPLAVLLGFMFYSRRIPVFPATLLGLIVLAGLIVAGNLFPLTLKVADPFLIWMVVLFVYAFFASILPVHILLQPRDYLSSFLLFFGIAVSVLGLLTRPLPLKGAHFFSFFSPGHGPMFPLMFITVACGAISGFHSLVSSGTTSKQLASEKHAQWVGYGAMITEGVLAVIALFCVAFGLRRIPSGITPVEVFSLGFGKAVYFLGDYAGVIAVVILNAFILTTLDTATRITRFLTQELLGISNKWLATALVVAAGAYLGVSGQWQNLWPMFGASNQLVAALALIVASAWLISTKKNYKIALIPAVVMLIITMAALVFNFFFFLQSETLKTGNKAVLCSLSVILAVMSGVIVSELRHLKRKEKK